MRGMTMTERAYGNRWAMLVVRDGGRSPLGSAWECGNSTTRMVWWGRFTLHLRVRPWFGCPIARAERSRVVVPIAERVAALYHRWYAG